MFIKKSAASCLAAKLKRLRFDLKKWSMTLSKIKLFIEFYNKAIFIIDELEDARKLSRPEINFRQLVKQHLEKLLSTQCKYWRSRCTARWIILGE